MSNSDGGYDTETHYLIGIHEPPNGLVALRNELAFHPDIVEFAVQGLNFENCLARIAMKLDIVLDGNYDVGPLCATLAEALRNRRFHGNQPHLRAKGLVAAEIAETASGISLREAGEAIKAPEGAIVIENDTTGPKGPGIIIEDVTLK